jgi:Trp operon repressor
MTNKRAYKALIQMLHQKRSTTEWDALLNDLLTPKERESLAERWQIIQLLASGMPQREIAKKLSLSISKITRGSRVLQQGRGGFKQALKKMKK